MKFTFTPAPKPNFISDADWSSWQWQLRSSLKNSNDFAKFFSLTESEKKAFSAGMEIFNIRTTPYYAALCGPDTEDPLRQILMPQQEELFLKKGDHLDPLGERKNNPTPRIIHRYSDRVLFLVTDICSVYCRYCTRKHFTGADQAFIKESEFQSAISYIQAHKGIREVILSGGDPLTLSDTNLERVLIELRRIEHIEIIRIGTRMPVVCPQRVTKNLVQTLKKYHPIFIMTHFNHPKELTKESAEALAWFVDNGFPVMNQSVLLNGVNNHPAILQALNRRLVYLRVKPYYVFQCDPSQGTDHLRTSVEETLKIQKELWGHLSGLAMPVFSLDIPDGGGKASLVPNFEISKDEQGRTYRGWDGVVSKYFNPTHPQIKKPQDVGLYLKEWREITDCKNTGGLQPITLECDRDI